MKKLAAALLAAALLVLPAQAVSGAPTVDAAAAVLMEKETGAILYEQNAHDKLEPASVTKVMTLLLVLEAIDDGRLALDDMVTVSAHAALHTPEALPAILETLLQEGYTFVPISELILPGEYNVDYTIDHTGRQFPAETVSTT